MGERGRRIRKNAVWNVGALVAGMALNFVSVPIIIRYLGSDQYGVLGLLLSFIGPLGLLDFGMSDATLKHLSEHYGKGDKGLAERFAQSALVFNLAVGAVGGIAIATAGPWLLAKVFSIPPQYAAEAERSVRIVGIVWMLTQIRQTCISVLMAAKRYDLSAGLTVATQAIILTAAIGSLVLGGSLSGLVTAQAIASAAMLVPWFVMTQRAVPDVHLRPIPHSESLKRTGKFGFWQMLNMLGGIVSQQSLRWILGLLLPISSIGFFNLSLQLANLPYLPGTKIAQVFFPEISSMQGQNQEREAGQLMLRTTWILGLFTMSVFVPLVVLAKDLLGLWVGHEIAFQASSVLQVLCAATAIGCLFQVPNYFLLGTGRVHWLGLMSFVQGAFTVGGSLVFVRSNGLVGAGIGMLMGTVVLVLVLLLLWRVAFRNDVAFRTYLSAIFQPYLVAASVAACGLWIRPAAGEWFSWTGVIVWGTVLSLLTLGSSYMLDRFFPGGGERHAFLRTFILQTVGSIKAGFRDRA